MSRRFYALFLSLVLIFALWGCQASRPADTGAQKTVTLTVIHKDGTEKAFTAQSSARYLGEAFSDQAVFSGEDSEYGLFITEADGEAANGQNEEWWCLTKGGEAVMTGIDLTPFSDGDQFELTFTIGY